MNLGLNGFALSHKYIREYDLLVLGNLVKEVVNDRLVVDVSKFGFSFMDGITESNVVVDTLIDSLEDLTWLDISNFSSAVKDSNNCHVTRDSNMAQLLLKWVEFVLLILVAHNCFSVTQLVNIAKSSEVNKEDRLFTFRCVLVEIFL